MEKLKKSKANYLQVNIFLFNQFYSYIAFDFYEKQKDFKDIFSLINVSFQSENNINENIPEESPKNPYLTEDYVPELEIINKNKVISDKIEYDIKAYIERINNSSSNEFLDDELTYNRCEKCQNDLNKYFCKNCHKNICNKCYEKCNIEKHDFINLYEMKEESYSKYIEKMKNFLNHNIIPIKEVNVNSIKEENSEDILLIIEIISQDYFNFFHFENIKKS